MLRERRLISVTLALAIAVALTPALGQEAEEPIGLEPAEEIPPAAPAEEPAAEDEKKPASLDVMWRDMLRYISTANTDAARSYAEAILASDPRPTTLYNLSVQFPRSMSILSRGSRLPGMQEIIDKFRKLIEEGYRADKADPERIRRSIELLDKGLEGFRLGRERIKGHGEYAIPQLVLKLMDRGTSDSMKARIISVLPTLGREAVRPLSAALQSSDPVLQEIFARALGQIEYPHSAPRLKELIDRKDTLERTRKLAREALAACGGLGVETMSAASLYYQTAEKYYYRAESLLPDPRSETANVWFWRSGVGLVYVPVPQEIFCDIYAMRMCRLALEHDPQFYPAVPLWISADLNREAKLPPGKIDPLGSQDRLPARFYALASGTSYLKTVVERALGDFNTPVAIAAMKPLVRTADSKSLIEYSKSGARPVIEAMGYPDREVRFYAAVSLAGAMPAEPFEGADIVMANLISALRESGGKVAMLICTELQQRNVIKGILREAGYKVIDASNVTTAIAEAQKQESGVDLTVIGTRPSAGPVIQVIRNRSLYANMPFVITRKSDELQMLARRDPKVLLVSPELRADEVKAAAAEALALGVGRALSPEEALNWAVTAAEKIRMLGLTGNKAFNITLTQPALIQALGDKRAQVQIAAAKALAIMSEPKAQRAIANLAISGSADTAVRVETFGVLTESIRRFGNQLADEHARTIISIVGGKGEPSLREAAAETLGAMNLATQDIIPLIKSFTGP